jgi:ABC-type phosphate transport system substrate-binding protein
LSVIVNEKNPIDQVTMAQVGALYRGEIKNWKAIGDYPKPVSLYGRQSNSGTYVFMQEFVLGNKNYSADMKEMKATPRSSRASFGTKAPSATSASATSSTRVGRSARASRS